MSGTPIVPAEEAVDRRRGLDYIGVGVCVLIHDGEGNILMMKRGEQARDERGRWDIVGGAIEFSESTEDALRREVMEEICVEPFNVEFLKAYDAHREHEGFPTHWVQLLHSAQVDVDKVKIGEPNKIAEIGWFNLSNLPQPQHSQFHRVLEIIKDTSVIQ